jgi:hypothetical protein
MDHPDRSERRRRERRFAERRHADHPVFLDTRLPAERRATQRRRRKQEA